MSVSQQASGFNYQIPPRYLIKNITDDYSNAIGYRVTSADYGLILNFKQSAYSNVQLPPAASVGAGFNFWIWNLAAAGFYQVSVKAVSSETIDTVSAINIQGGEGVQFVSDGSNWQSGSGKLLQLYSEAYTATSTKPSATGSNSVAIGSGTSASATNGVAIGPNSSANGTSSTAIGYQCVANVAYSTAIGSQNSANQFYSLALGNNSTTNAICKTSFGSSATNGVQWGILPLFAATTSNVATALTSNGSAASTNNQLIVPSSTAISFSILVVARQQASGGTASAAWQVTGLIRREALASTTTLVGTPTVTAISNTPAWTLAVAADTTRGALTVRGTGATSTNINWLATVYSSEMTYA